jgi:hypothetical protein
VCQCTGTLHYFTQVSYAELIQVGFHKFKLLKVGAGLQLNKEFLSNFPVDSTMTEPQYFKVLRMPLPDKIGNRSDTITIDIILSDHKTFKMCLIHQSLQNS